MKRIWKMKDGTKIAIRDMKTSHIQNCVAMLKRYHDAKTENFVALGNTLSAEQACMDFDNEIEDLFENGWQDEAQEYLDSFNRELLRRGVHP